MPPPNGTSDDPRPSPARVGRPAAHALLVAFAVFVGAVLSLGGLYIRASSVLKQEVREDLMRLAESAAANVDADAHDQIWRADQMGSREYDRVFAPLARMLASVRGCKYIYTGRLSDGAVYFVVDSAASGDHDGDGVDDQAKVMELYEDAPPEMLAALTQGISMSTEVPYSDKWGTFMSGWAPIRRSDGTLSGVIGIDITANEYTARVASMRRALLLGLIPAALVGSLAAIGVFVFRKSEMAARAEVAECDSRLQLLTDHMDDFVGVSGFNDERLYVSPSWTRITGWTIEELKANDWRTRVHPADLQAVEDAHRRNLAGERTMVRYRARCRDGRFLWLECSASPVLGPDGRVERIVWSSRDISGRIEAEALAREHAARLRAFVEHAPATIAMFDKQMRYICTSKQWLREYGLNENEILGRSCYETRDLPVDSREVHARCLAGSIERCEAEHYDQPDRGQGWIRWEVRPWYDADGEIGGLLILTEDITAQREVQNKLRLASEAADAANRAKSEFLANMSHEIRTPMTAVLGYLDLLEEALEDPAQSRSNVATIRRNAQHLLSVINDVLDLSKIEAGRMTVESLPVSPVELAREVLELYRPNAAAKGLPLVFEPEGALPAVIRTDPLRLRQILTNLVGNAVKFTQAGQVAITIRLEEHTSAAPRLRFSVRDSGIGMSPEQIELLFKPFSQADATTTRRFGGTGLGLAICRRLASLLGGEITARSQAGAGSTFEFTIATGSLVGVELLEPGAAPLPPKARGTEAAVALRGRVLLAEDGPDNQRLIAHFLTRAGLQVRVVENGLLAVEAMSESGSLRSPSPFDLVVLDMQMPVMDGYTAAGRLRELGYTGPILALTANAMSGDRERCVAAGCDDYATKPIDRTALRAACARLLAGVAA
jgi:PAS domain S-box-containing protein